MTQPATETGPAPRPGVLTFLLGAGVVLGAAGVLLGLFGIFQALQTKEGMLEQVRRTNEWTEAILSAGIDEEARRIQEEMTLEMAEAQLGLRPLSVPTWTLNAILSAGLLAGAILVFKRRDRWRRALVGVAVAHLPYELLYVALTWRSTQINFAATRKWLPRLTEAMSQATATPAGLGDLTGTMMKASYYLGLGLAVGIAVSLSAYYVWLALYLRSERARAYCDR